MRRVLVVIVLGMLLLGHPVPGRAQPGSEFGLAVGAAGANLLYMPAKWITALGGLVLGGMTGLLTGGDERAAYAVWVPAATGTFILTPSNLDGTEPIEFLGSDYADRPSKATSTHQGRGIYEAQYSR